MIHEYNISCDCIDCRYARQEEEDQLSIAVGLIGGFGIACVLYFLLTLILY